MVFNLWKYLISRNTIFIYNTLFHRNFQVHHIMQVSTCNTIIYSLVQGVAIFLTIFLACILYMLQCLLLHAGFKHVMQRPIFFTFSQVLEVRWSPVSCCKLYHTANGWLPKDVHVLHMENYLCYYSSGIQIF